MQALSGIHRATVVALALALASPARAGELPWYVPDRAKVQFAGNIGFLSPGVGWAFERARLESDVFFGWVPASVGGKDIVSVTGKLTWLPWEVPLDGRWILRPLTAGLQLTYTFGDEYFVDEPDQFESGYYDYPTALHAGVTLGGVLGRRGHGRIRELGIYWEAVAIDSGLVLWIRNRDTLGPVDVFSLALGVRMSF